MNRLKPLVRMLSFAVVVAIAMAPTEANAQPEECAPLSDGAAYRLTETRQLSPEIPESPSGTQSGFHTDAVFIMIAQGERVLLSGSETGSGFVTDDEFTLQTIPAERSQTWNFQSEDRMYIVPANVPEDITHLFLENRFNMVQVTMTDILPPFYRASELWLMRYSPCSAAKPVAAATTVTATPVIVPTATPRVIATALPESDGGISLDTSETAETAPVTVSTSNVPADAEMPTTMEDSPVQTVPVTPISLGLILIGLVIYWLITTGTLKNLPSWKEIQAYIEERLKE